MRKRQEKTKKQAQVVLRSSAALALVLLMAAGQAGLLGPAAFESAARAEQAWSLVLVNGSCELPDGFTVELAEAENGYQVDARIADALRDMLQGARDAGLRPVLCSAYRTESYQTYLYNRKVGQYREKGYSQAGAKTAAARWVAPPGTSEHQLGLAVDIISSSYQKLDRGQEDTREQQWLMQHCWEYGFILRYPDDKSDITGIAYEPWHYRYVGKAAAREITEQGVCLEEYLAR